MPDMYIERQCDYKEIASLNQLVYGNSDLDKFEWLYKNNPAGEADIFIARESKSTKVIGALAYFPMRIWFHNKDILIGQAIDAIVHPDYRGKRIFNLIMRQSFASLSQKYAFLIGFPNKLAINSELRAGWQLYSQLKTYSIALEATAFSEKIITSKLLSKCVTSMLNHPMKALERIRLNRINTDECKLAPASTNFVQSEKLHESLREIHPLINIRDKDFLTWRFSSIPSKQYAIQEYLFRNIVYGYFVADFDGKAVNIVDLCTHRDINHQLRLLKLLIEYSISLGKTSIHFKVCHNAYCIDALRKVGLFPRKGGSAIIIYPFSQKLEKLRESAFYLTLADTDWI